MNVKNIIFDIGGVLAGPKSGHWFITTNFWNIIDKDKVDEEKLKDSLKKYLYLQTQEPKIESEEHLMFSNYYYEVLKEIEYPNLTKEIADKIADDCVYNDDKFIFYNDVKEVIEELSKEYNLYIISNGWPSSFRVLKNKGLDSYFKGIFISSMYSTTKEEKLFDIFLDKYKEVNPRESIYIDDRRHILTKAEEYGFNLLLMDRKKVYSDINFKKINDLDSIIGILSGKDVYCDYSIIKLNENIRSEVNDILINEWESTDIIIRGNIIDGTKLDGFVALKDNKIIGLITYMFENDECEICSLNSFIENKGIGTSLINKVIECARQNKCTRLKLITTNDNIRGIEFYQRRGFVFSNIYKNAIEYSRMIKPQIPLFADNGLPIRDEIEFEMML